MAMTSVNYGSHEISSAALLAAIDSVEISNISGGGLYLVPVGGGRVQVIGVSGD